MTWAGVDRSPAELLAWTRAHPPDLSWLERPARHQFRWRDASGRWHTADRRVSTPEAFARVVTHHPPRDAYVGTASWLDPVALPRLRDARSPAPILLDHLVVFDIDAAPWSLWRLDAARRATRRLLEWVERETDLVLVHVTYSGAKGFHVVARDPDRSPFQEPDPRTREARVRDARRRVLRRALDADHPVDPTVTADTRRVIRLPGTLHGATGWACSIIPRHRLDEPVRGWLPGLPRHGRAVLPPAWTMPRLRLPRLRLPHRPRAKAPSRLELQASTHVPGTEDRSALLAWLPQRWGADAAALLRVERRLREAGLGPGLVWRADERLLLLVPRAIPRARLARVAPKFGLGGLPAALDARGHAWVAVAPASWEDGAEEPPLDVVGVVDAPCAHPWSRAHLDLARRLGRPLDDVVEAAGTPRAKLRLAQIR